jgi:hypothetical protein
MVTTTSAVGAVMFETLMVAALAPSVWFTDASIPVPVADTSNVEPAGSAVVSIVS